MTLRLLYVTARAPFGRDEPFVMDEIAALRRRGHDVRIVPLLPAGGIVHGAAKDWLPQTERPWPWSPRVLGAALLELLRAPRACLAALRLLLTPRPRALLANLLFFPKALWLARRARALGTHHIHAHWATTPAAVAMAAATVAGLPWSFTAHRYDLERNDLLARKARAAAFLRVISRHGERRARQLIADPRVRIDCIHMGVPLPAAARITRAPRSPAVLLCPARLVDVKNHAGLLRAFAQVKAPAELWLAGAGPLRQAIVGAIRALGLRNVRLLGALPHARVLELYERGSVDAVILASTVEGIPVALMEAMAAGVPVIATSVGGVPELTGMGAGMLVPAGDDARLAWAIEELLRDPALRARLAKAGRARIVRRFSQERSIDRLERRFAAQVQGVDGSLTSAGMRKRTSAWYRPRYALASASAASASGNGSFHQASPEATPPTSSGAA